MAGVLSNIAILVRFSAFKNGVEMESLGYLLRCILSSLPWSEDGWE